jgi:protocatechuate 3,4-dioxygenase beta subunit
MHYSRRELIQNATRLVLAGSTWMTTRASFAKARFQATPRQGRGPFYPPNPPSDAGNVLIRADAQGRTLGEILELHGRIIDPNGNPIAGALVEIWQCDANGRYHHPRDNGPRPLDPNFSGYGRDNTDADGQYRFKTIKPVPYPGRTPHIHFAVAAPGLEELVTQMYLDGHPMNARDYLFRRSLPPGVPGTLLAALNPASDGQAAWEAQFDIVLRTQ